MENTSLPPSGWGSDLSQVKELKHCCFLVFSLWPGWDGGVFPELGVCANAVLLSVPRLWHTACASEEGEVIIFGGCANNLLAHSKAVSWF